MLSDDKNISLLDKRTMVHDPIGFQYGWLKGLSALYGDQVLKDSLQEMKDRIPNSTIYDYSEIASAYYTFFESYLGNHRDPFARNLWTEFNRQPHDDLGTFINEKQVSCKQWLVESLAAVGLKKFDTVYVLGGWFGALSHQLLSDDRFEINRIISMDINPQATETAQRLLHHYNVENRFHAVTEDMFQVEYKDTKFFETQGSQVREVNVDKVDLVINTSFEHIVNYKNWLNQIPAGTQLVVQSNNYFSEPTHVNCVHTLGEFLEQLSLNKVTFSGEFETKKYTRFMVIGEK